MAAYLIVEHKITDPAKFEEYRTKSVLQSQNTAGGIALKVVLIGSLRRLTGGPTEWQSSRSPTSRL
jgi:uncharacterized protein (DUF1330 family)